LYAGQIPVVVLVIAGNPVDRFKIIGKVVEKFVVFFNQFEQRDVACEQEDFAGWLNGRVLQEFFVFPKFEVKVGTVLDFHKV
jgi:hypothetical protein